MFMTIQECSAGTPTELLDISPSASKSLYNVVNVVAEFVNLSDVVKARERDIET